MNVFILNMVVRGLVTGLLFYLPPFHGKKSCEHFFDIKTRFSRFCFFLTFLSNNTSGIRKFMGWSGWGRGGKGVIIMIIASKKVIIIY